MPSRHKPELIQPRIFDDSESIGAWFTCKNVDLYSSPHSIPGLNLGFNTREDEDVVKKNRRELLDILGIEPNRIAYAEQVHGNEVQIINEGGIYRNVDALVSDVKGLSLAIQVADCAAVLMADPDVGVIAAAHAGWRGAAGDIVPKTVSAMKSLGAVPSRLKAFISPCISQKHFEVGEEVAIQFPSEFVDYTSYEKPHVNLKEFLVSQLNKLGIDNTHIEVNEGCTIDDAGRFYSYRREQQQSGRMLGIIRNEE